MERIKNLKYTKETYLYSIAGLLERASFYGLRALLLIYFFSEFQRIEILKTIEWIATAYLISRIIGAVIGDLLLGNKKAIIVGGILNAMGAFTLCFPSITAFYIGLFLIVLGNGLLKPNLTSSFGKLFLNKQKLLNPAFTLFYLAINIGSFFGVIIIGYIGEKWGWNYGFVIVGVLMLLSIIPILLSDPIKTELIPTKKITVKNRIIYISIALVSVSLYWGLHEMGMFRINDLQLKIAEVLSFDPPTSVWVSLDSLLALFSSIILIILWSYFYSSQTIRLMLGFVFGAISFGILFFIPTIPAEKHLLFYLISLVFLAISDIYISPVIQSTLTKFSNPKYLTIILSLAFIPAKVFSLFLDPFNANLAKFPNLALKYAFFGMLISGVAFIIYIIWKRKKV